MSAPSENNEDLMGCMRGACCDSGCDGFVLHVPGKKKGVWGWNDTAALNCKRCGEAAAKHELLSTPGMEPRTQRHAPAAARAMVGESPVDLEARAEDGSVSALLHAMVKVIVEVVSPELENLAHLAERGTAGDPPAGDGSSASSLRNGFSVALATAQAPAEKMVVVRTLIARLPAEVQQRVNAEVRRRLGGDDLPRDTTPLGGALAVASPPTELDASCDPLAIAGAALARQDAAIAAAAGPPPSAAAATPRSVGTEGDQVISEQEAQLLATAKSLRQAGNEAAAAQLEKAAAALRSSAEPDDDPPEVPARELEKLRAATFKQEQVAAPPAAGSPTTEEWISLLAAARLPASYAGLLEEEEITLQDIAVMMQRGGRGTVEAALCEAGISRIDHRLRIADAALLAL